MYRLERQVNEDRNLLSWLVEQHEGLIAQLKARDIILQKSFDNIDHQLERHRQQINIVAADTELLQVAHQSLTDRVSEMGGGEDADGVIGRLSDISYGVLNRSSSEWSFQDREESSPLAVPPLSGGIVPEDVGLLPSSQDSASSSSSGPRSQQFVEMVTDLVEVEEETAQVVLHPMDPDAAREHAIAREALRTQELVRSILNQRCRSKHHPSHSHSFHPYPHPGDGVRRFPFS